MATWNPGSETRAVSSPEVRAVIFLALKNGIIKKNFCILWMLHTDIHQGPSVEISWKQVQNNKCFFPNTRFSNKWNRHSRKQKFTMTATRKRRIYLSKMKQLKFLFQTAECDEISFSTTPVLRSAKTWSEAKASPIKCFVSHRPTDPFFWKLSKTKIKITCKETNTLVNNTSSRSYLINTNHRYFVFVAFLDIW